MDATWAACQRFAPAPAWGAPATATARVLPCAWRACRRCPPALPGPGQMCTRAGRAAHQQRMATRPSLALWCTPSPTAASVNVIAAALPVYAPGVGPMRWCDLVPTFPGAAASPADQRDRTPATWRRPCGMTLRVVAEEPAPRHRLQPPASCTWCLCLVSWTLLQGPRSMRILGWMVLQDGKAVGAGDERTECVARARRLPLHHQEAGPTPLEGTGAVQASA